MTRPAVELESNEFLNNFFAIPSGSLRKGPRTLNFFKNLENADKMPSNEVATHVVEAIREYSLAAPLAISQYKSKAPTFAESPKDMVIGMFRERDVCDGQPPHWANAIIQVEFERHITGADPFDNGEYDDRYDDLDLRRKQLLKKITATAEYLCAAQHRLSLFVLLIIGRRFRLLRLDRAGIIVTPAVDYYQHPDALCDFLSRAAHLDDTSLGFDHTASRVLPDSIDYLRMEIAALEHLDDIDHEERRLQEGEFTDPVIFKYVRTAFRESLKSDWPRHKLEVPDGPKKRQFLVGKPVFRASGTIGRGTRGYVAYDCQTRRFVWLKDAWRASYIIADTEGDVLAKLNAAGVTNVPTLVCHGDIDDQTTITADWWERTRTTFPMLATPSASSSSTSSHTLTTSTSACGKKRKIQEALDEDDSGKSSRRHHSPEATIRSDCPLRQHTHYRIVVEEVCMPLKLFKCGKQLVSLLLDTLQAHSEAATNPKIRLLHRDISGGNILIYPKVRCRKAGKKRALVWTGLLCDWELAKPVDDQNTPSRLSQADRMGTYQFMSVNLLSNLTNSVKIADELESFFHVLVYYSVRYLQSNCDYVKSFMQRYFHSYAGPGRLYCCGQKSVIMQVTGELETEIPCRSLVFDSPMDNLIEFTLECFHSRYKMIQHALRMKDQPSPPPIATITPSSPGPAIAAAPQSPIYKSSPPLEDVDDENVIDWNAPPRYEVPTAEDEQRAEKIADHKFMLNVFATALRQRFWTADRVAVSPDAVVEDADTDATSEPASEVSTSEATSASTSNKRQRTASPQADYTGPTLRSLPPNRLHASTRRSRNQARTMPIRARARPQGARLGD